MADASVLVDQTAGLVQCITGASELATACDLVYVWKDAQIGHPPVRSMSPTHECALREHEA
jgi:hypothetical protein